ncbi:MAG: glycoside hydrolase family 2, partial [Bacteroidetes bacterium]
MRIMLFLALATCLSPVILLAQLTERVYLSGTDKDHTVNWDFLIDKGMNSGEWTTIPVPSNWELEGFGVYNYGRNWPVKQTPSDETGQYRHTFEVPRSWRGQVIRLVFEGVMTDTEVRVNGKSAGPIHQGSFYRFAYDISDLLRYGRRNRLEVTVRNWSANASVNTAEREADYWLFGGIYRPVYLAVSPPAHIEWTAIDARHGGAFRLLAHGQHFGEASALEVQVETLDGEAAGPVLRGSRSPGDTTITVSGQFEGVNSWSPEFPHRYRARVRLLAGDEVLHQRVETFGFRTVELRERDGLYVNGVKVMLKGANRHSFWPESGRCLSPAISVADVQLMKDMN